MCHLSTSRGDSGREEGDGGRVDEVRGEVVDDQRGDRGGVMRLMRVWRMVSTVLCSSRHHGSLITASTGSPAEAACRINDRCSLDVDGMDGAAAEGRLEGGMRGGVEKV